MSAHTPTRLEKALEDAGVIYGKSDGHYYYNGLIDYVILDEYLAQASAALDEAERAQRELIGEMREALADVMQDIRETGIFNGDPWPAGSRAVILLDRIAKCKALEEDGEEVKP